MRSRRNSQSDRRESVPVLTCEKVNYGEKPEQGVYLARGKGGRWEAIARPTAKNASQAIDPDPGTDADRRNRTGQTQRSGAAMNEPRDETKLQKLGG